MNPVSLFAVWYPEEESYITISDESTEALVCEPAVELLMEETDGSLFTDMKDHKMTGTLESLSDTPELLASLIESESSLTYDSEKRKLKFKGKKLATLLALNELLKNKPFEIRQLNLEKIKEIECSLY